MDQNKVDRTRYPYQRGSFFVSKRMVLGGGGGHYIGRTCWNPEGFEEPWSRESGYYATTEQAEDVFSRISEVEPWSLTRSWLTLLSSSSEHMRRGISHDLP